MKPVSIICAGLLLLGSPQQYHYNINSVAAPNLQRYLIEKTKKERLRAQPNIFWQGLNNSLRFIGGSCPGNIFTGIAN